VSTSSRPLTLVTGGSRGLGAATDVDALFDAAGQLGPVTGLVASAGLTARLGDLADTLAVGPGGRLLHRRRAARRRWSGAGHHVGIVSSRWMNSSRLPTGSSA
jgi:hypothetical protein